MEGGEEGERGRGCPTSQNGKIKMIKIH